MLIPRWITIQLICFPVQSRLGLIMAGVRTWLPQSGSQRRMFWTYVQSRSVSRKADATECIFGYAYDGVVFLR